MHFQKAQSARCSSIQSLKTNDAKRFIQSCVSSCFTAPEVADVRVDAWEVPLCARNHSPRDNSGQLQSPVLILSRVINTIVNSLISWFLKIPPNMWIKSHYLNIFPAFNLDWHCQKCTDHMKTFCQKLVKSWPADQHLVGADKGAATVTRARPSTLEHFEMQSLLCECIEYTVFMICTYICIIENRSVFRVKAMQISL